MHYCEHKQKVKRRSLFSCFQGYRGFLVACQSLFIKEQLVVSLNKWTLHMGLVQFDNQTENLCDENVTIYYIIYVWYYLYCVPFICTFLQHMIPKVAATISIIPTTAMTAIILPTSKEWRAVKLACKTISCCTWLCTYYNIFSLLSSVGDNRIRCDYISSTAGSRSAIWVVIFRGTFCM